MGGGICRFTDSFHKLRLGQREGVGGEATGEGGEEDVWEQGWIAQPCLCTEPHFVPDTKGYFEDIHAYVLVKCNQNRGMLVGSIQG